MKKYNFKNDYSEGCHHDILRKLTETNMHQQDGYGDDDYSMLAKKMIKQKLDDDNVDIHFVSGGTQANIIVISSILKPYESVISANSGHINVHETGAIEATGHKINAVNTSNGKLCATDIQTVLDEHNIVPHMVKPKLVYISNSTELGSIYKKQDLEELFSFCQNKNLYLFLDGARLGSALTSNENDLSLSDISRLTDVFYIGGTKNGALIGEAIVISNNILKEDFNYNIKQKGALISKGRLIGIQFFVLFESNLYFKLAKHANLMSGKIAKAISSCAFSFFTPPVSNQIFPILPNALIEILMLKYDFYVWQKIDDNNSAVRLITSWATKEDIVDEFICEIKKYKTKCKSKQVAH